MNWLVKTKVKSLFGIIGDGRVCGSCKSMEGKILENMAEIPDDLHTNCRCYIEEIDLKSV